MKPRSWLSIARGFVAAITVAGSAALQAQGSIEARFYCDPAEVEVGEPFELVLELEGPAGVDFFDIARSELELDESWVAFGALTDPPSASTSAGKRRVLRRRWTLASLEPGERSLAETVSALVADPRVSKVRSGEARVAIRGVLGAEEDEPRPLRGLPERFGTQVASSASPWRLVAGGSALFFWGLVLALVWRRRAGPKERDAARATPEERLVELSSELEGAAGDGRGADAQTIHRAHFALTEIVRAAIDGRQARERGGLTDQEWLADARAVGLPESLSHELAGLFERVEAVKYGGQRPTRWALDEVLEQARSVVVQAQAPERAA